MTRAPGCVGASCSRDLSQSCRCSRRLQSPHLSRHGRPVRGQFNNQAKNVSHLPPTKAHVHLSPTVIFSFVQKGSQHLRRSPPSSPGRRTGGHGCPPLQPHPKGRCLLTPRSPCPSPSCSPRLSPRTDSCLPSMRSTAKPSWDGAKPHSAALSLPEGPQVSPRPAVGQLLRPAAPA